MATSNNDARPQEETDTSRSNAATAGDVRTGVVVVGLILAVRWLARRLFRLLGRPL